MKKISIVTLLILFISTNVYADNATLVGREIQREIVVRVDGKELEHKAILIDGVSYLPLREFAEGMDYKVTFDHKEGINLYKTKIERRLGTPLTREEMEEALNK